MDGNSDLDSALLQDLEKCSHMLADSDHEVRIELSSYYAVLKLKQFQLCGKAEDLEEAIEKARYAVNKTAKEDRQLEKRLNNLGVALEYRYERSGKINDLDEGIEVARQAVDVMPNNDPDFASVLTNLGNKLFRRYERIGELRDLKEAIHVDRQALNIASDGRPHLATMLNNLGTKLLRQYERTKNMCDLDEGIRVTRQAADATPTGHPRLGGRLNNLGNQLSYRYERTGNMNDLEEAITTSRRAVNATSRKSPDLAARLGSLGNHLETRYVRTGRMEDLDEAIRVAHQSVSATPKDHASLGKRLNSLGSKLSQRYERMQKREDLEEATLLVRKAIDVTPDNHPDFAAMLNNLANKLRSRFEQTKEMKDLDEAIRVSRHAVQVTPDGHNDLAHRLSNLGRSLQMRFERTGDIENYEEAIRVSQQAVQLTPDDHSHLAAFLNELGNTLLLSASSAKDNILKVFLRAWNCYNATPFTRIRSSTRLIQLLQEMGRYDEAYSISLEAIDLLPLVHNRSLSHDDQQYVVSTFSGLATSACSLALHNGQSPVKALDILERGRGVILGLLIDDRSDTSALKAAHSELFALYEHLRSEVNPPFNSIADQRLQQIAIERRPNAILDLDKCIQDIRKLPGFSRFQMGLTAEQMQECAADGSIVIVNSTDLRSDAIIVSTSGFRTIPLPGLESSRMKSWIDEDLTNNKTYLCFLSWLWRKGVKLVLEELGYHVVSSVESLDSLPRIWWIGTGLASSLPFHAAGDNTAGQTENAYYWVVSSYTPTIKALKYAKQRVISSTKSCSGPPKILIVTMATTPGADELPKAEPERSEVIAAVGASTIVKVLDQPNVASVMQHIGQFQIVHFACHGESDPVDPSRSGLLLQTANMATAEPEQDVLSVGKISLAHLSHADIAYLSACSTAENGVTVLVDEVLHVVSGFQVAGFRHVIGCLWPSNDGVCVKVAKSFYSQLVKGGELRYSDRDVALALQNAVLEIKNSNEYRRRPLRWAQYVHFGA